MEGHGSISSDILASYAADAAREVAGVDALVESRLPPHKGVRVAEEDGSVTVELHLRIGADRSIPSVGRAVQERVRAYLRRMADLEPAAVNIVVDEIA